jgi:glycerol-1-phosphate dehydrogenase [NAD(P)+]
MKYIELPRKVLIGDNVIEKVPNVAADLGLSGASVVVADATTGKLAGERIARMLESQTFIAGDAGMGEVENLITASKECSFLIACGGGTVNDIAKLASFNKGIPYINVPTSASHDGIASPQASLKGEKPVSVRAHCPLGVVADLEILKNAPKRLTASGCADAISNYTAVLDWRLAHKEKGEYYGDYAAALSDMSARIVMENAKNIKGSISILVEALISSGVAMGIAGSSRPCSGSEHAFSHALDMICEKPALHGEQCGLGTIMMAYLHKADWQAVRDALKDCGAPVTGKEIGVSEDKIIEALLKAHSIRDRYSILRGGLDEQTARRVAEATGVV